MRKLPRPLPFFLAAAIALGGTAANAVDLTAGRTLLAKDSSNPKADKIKFKYVRDPGLNALASPLCPAQSKLLIYDSNAIHSEIVLDCNNRTIAGPGYRYKEALSARAASGRSPIDLGGLSVSLEGSPLQQRSGDRPGDLRRDPPVDRRVRVLGRWKRLRAPSRRTARP
jgi:hypothetical protein